MNYLNKLGIFNGVFIPNKASYFTELKNSVIKNEYNNYEVNDFMIEILQKSVFKEFLKDGRINLSSEKLGEKGKQNTEYFKFFTEAFKEIRNFTSLDLSYNFLGKKDTLKILSKWMKENLYITE